MGYAVGLGGQSIRTLPEPWGLGEELGLAGAICRVLPSGGFMVPGLLYVTGWSVMSAAMMLPTALPLIRLFDRMIVAGRTARRCTRCSSQAICWPGAASVSWRTGWTRAARTVVSLRMAGDARLRPGIAVLAGAGAFQFSRLKYHCLDACRSPFAFISSHWHGPRPYRDALGLGLAHGVYCVGCCWALMLIMFLVGSGSVGWMLVLGLIMAMEKNHAWGRHLAMPLGVTLLTAAALIGIAHLIQLV